MLKQFESESVNCIVTSPPYWGMRKYDDVDGNFEIGLERDYELYIGHLRAVFLEAMRILKEDGSLWLNLGDKYQGKALMGMPWRVALALIDDGWILRNDVIWSQMKGTQSCKDRLRDSYEHIFHFVKNKRYFYDADAIRVKPTKHPHVADGVFVSSTGVSGVKYRKLITDSKVLSDIEKKNALDALKHTIEQVKKGEINDFRMTIRGAQRAWHSDNTSISGRAAELEKHGFYIMKMGAKGPIPTDIWNVVTEDKWRTDSHCAVYPEELLRIPLLSTTRRDDVVLDPFSGTGTTVVAALKSGRRGVGIDLSSEYTRIAQERIDDLGFIL